MEPQWERLVELDLDRPPYFPRLIAGQVVEEGEEGGTQGEEEAGWT